MIVLLSTVLVTSLLGSLHCAAMCGPFVAFYGGRERGPWTHVAYNVGRLVTYVSLGALAGAVGAAVDLAGRAADVQRVAALLASALILAWGGIALLRALGVSLPLFGGTAPGAASERLVRLRRRPPIVRAGALGLLTAALPCGWLYAFVVAAAGTGSAPAGAALMLAFWLGTVPMLVGLGVTARRLARALGGRLPVITAALLIAVGIAGIASRAPMFGMTHAAHAAHAGSAAAVVVPAEPTCHGQ